MGTAEAFFPRAWELFKPQLSPEQAMSILNEIKGAGACSLHSPQTLHPPPRPTPFTLRPTPHTLILCPAGPTPRVVVFGLGFDSLLWHRAAGCGKTFFLEVRPKP